MEFEFTFQCIIPTSPLKSIMGDLPVVVLEETGVPLVNHQPTLSHCQPLHDAWEMGPEPTTYGPSRGGEAEWQGSMLTMQP